MDRDDLLVLKMRGGDEKALETFVEKYYPAILRYCRLHIDDRGYAEDMAQETFARFFRTLRQYRHYGKAANYLYAIAANVCRDYYRQNQNRELPMEQLPETCDAGAESTELGVQMRMAFDSLPDELREVAVLYFAQERKQKDIAAALGIGLPLVKYRIGRARELLAAYLGKE
ncbi:MAG: RNA polymerase sigma factor [bacterium]|nr:RNA polymerase sigma factor [bacterium]MCM1376526.1 RNA polymerase sigma factor [Muribaculum sp.]